jgi:hypothetical protein
MYFAAFMAVVAIASGTLLTYLYERDTLLWWRLCAGVCLGITTLGLTGFVLASWFGMTSATLIVAVLLNGSPLLLLQRRKLRDRIVEDFTSSLEVVRRSVVTVEPRSWAVFAFYLTTATLFWYVCDRTMFENVAGMFTGMDTNIGDLPFHLAVINGFVHGQNFPPQHPEFAGASLTYPFVVDFVTAMFVRAGASTESAFFWQNYLTILALTGLLHRWALRLTRDRIAALIAPALVFLSGGFGWWLFLKESAQNGGVFQLLPKLQHDYTIMAGGYRWGNALIALFVPQRGILLGVALSLIVWTIWLQASEATGTGPGSFGFLTRPFIFRLMAVAGLVAGMMPLVHAHSFVVTMTMGGCLALLQLLYAIKGIERAEQQQPSQGSLRERLQPICLPWAVFFCLAIVIGGPQALWATRGSAMGAGKFFAWTFGWDHGTENVFLFWIKNTGFFIPLLVAAAIWHWREKLAPPRVIYFCIPFTLCFVFPNFFRLAPWVWDNIKVLTYWWIASSPLVAILLARLWRAKGALRVVGIILLISQTGAGALDVWRAASGSVERQTFDQDAVAFAEQIKRVTAPGSLILHAPTYNDPVYLTGRRSFMGYPGHLWSHGIDYGNREAQLKTLYTAAPEAAGLIEKLSIEYVVVGPLEKAWLQEQNLKLNKEFFAQYNKVGEQNEYQLYQTAQTKK